MGLATPLVFIGVVFAIVIIRGSLKHSQRLHASPLVVGVLIVVFGVACFVVARRVELPLDPSCDDGLAASYRRRWLLWVGLGEVPTLVGIIVLVATHQCWCHPFGAQAPIGSLTRLGIGCCRRIQSSRCIQCDLDVPGIAANRRAAHAALRYAEPPVTL